MDARNLPVLWRVFSFQPSSRELSALEMYVYLFTVFACELFWNVLANQKGFLYITVRFVEKDSRFFLNKEKHS